MNLDFPLHQFFMQRCLQLAQMGFGNVSPNPMVGAVLVHDDKIIGEGYHKKYGDAHAEINCINSVKNKLLIPFSTLYVSLEPCSHFGKTPPCANFIIENKIKKVVVATTDFSSKVNGKGIQLLRENGVEVVEHILEKEAIKINKRFFYSQQNKMPFVILKWAESADGFIAKQNEQVQLSNEIANTIVHQWRHEEDAIWVGFNTAKIDNPKLNVRHIEGKNPTRILFDKELSLDTNAHFLDNSQPTIIYNCIKSSTENLTTFVKIDANNFIEKILIDLYTRTISSVIIEGGTKILQQFIDQNLWNEARIIYTNIELKEGVKCPQLKNYLLDDKLIVQDNHIHIFKIKN